MPYKPKDRDGNPISIWWARGPDGSRRSTGTTDRREAEATEAEWKAQRLRKKKKTDIHKSPTFEDLMLAYLGGPSLEKRSMKRDWHSLDRLQAFFADDFELEKLTIADRKGYIAKRTVDGVKSSTIKRELALFSAAINWANFEMGWSVPNPFERMRLKAGKPRDRWGSKEEMASLLEAAKAGPGHLADFIVLGLNTGMRSGEMLGLEWNRVDLKNNLVYLGSGDQKNGKLGTIPLNKAAREAILSRARFRAGNCPASPWVFSHEGGERIVSIKKSFATACKRSGIKDFHPHDLRRTCATHLILDGERIEVISRLLRHSDISVTTKVYAHLDTASLRSAVSRLEDRSKQSVTTPDFDQIKLGK